MADLTGTSGDDTLAGTSGDDNCSGLGGSDTYVYNVTTSGGVVTAADGFDTIVNADTDGTGYDKLVFSGLKFANFVGERVGVDLRLDVHPQPTVNGDPVDAPIGSVTVKDFFTTNPANHVDLIEFDDAYIAVSFAGGVLKAEVYLKGSPASLQNTVQWDLGGVDTLTGTPGEDQMDGEGGNDTLSGLAGDDELDGGEGDDTLIGGLGNDDLDGGAGTDTADYSGASGPMNINLGALAFGPLAPSGASGSDGIDTLIDIENATGTAFGDNLVGSAADNLLSGGGGTDSLYGRLGNDTLLGGDGNDNLFGADGPSGVDVAGDGADTLDGGNGNDVIRGNAGADTLLGGDGNDNLRGDSGNDTIDGGTGSDVVSYLFSQGGYSTGVTFDASSFVIGSSVAAPFTYPTATGTETDTLTSIEQFLFAGTPYADTAIGSSGDDQLGGNGGNDTLDGRGGIDAADYSQAPSAVLVNLDTVVVAGLAPSSSSGGDGDDTLLNIENVFGSAHNDILVGDATANVLSGSRGSDTLHGGDGNDTLYGANGSSGVNVAGDGADTLDGGKGDDVIRGNAGADTLLGGDDNDNLRGDSGNDTIDGGAGDDVVSYRFDEGGYSTGVTFDASGFTVGSSVAAPFTYSTPTGSETDSLVNIERFLFSGTPHGDTAIGSAGNDQLGGNDGNDVLDGRAGNDTLFGGSGVDSLVGGTGDDTLWGDGGDDTYTYNVTMTAGVVTAADGNDTIFNFDGTGAGYDKLVFSGLKSANFAGERVGADLRLDVHPQPTVDGDPIDAPIGSVTVKDFFTTNPANHLDRIEFDDAYIAVSFASGVLKAEVYVKGSPDVLQETVQWDLGGVNSLTGTVGQDQLNGEDGNDVLDGLGGDDELDGGEGNDTLIGGAGNDDLIGGAGIDTADYSGATGGVNVNLDTVAADISNSGIGGFFVGPQFASGGGQGVDYLEGIENVTGGAFNDRLRGDGADNTLTGNGGPDILFGSAGADTLYGGEGNDTLYGGNSSSGVEVVGDGADTLEGGNGDDVIRGNAGADTLLGGDGNDNLRGDSGNDTIDGGTGTDVAAYRFDEPGYGFSSGVTFDASAFPVGSSVAAPFTYATPTGGTETDSLVNVERFLFAGTSFDDTAIGSAGDDQLGGNGGDDILKGGAGNDSILGDGGNDTAVFSGARADYSVSNAGTLTITDLRAGSPDGTDTATAVESFQFTSGTLSLDQLLNAPFGSASATLAAATEETSYTIYESDLLQGFTDPNSNPLSVQNLSASSGSLVDNDDGTWTFTPAADFAGTVDLTYEVADTNGYTVAATQSFSVTNVNDAPRGSATAVLTAGTEDLAYTITAASLLTGFSDVDNDTLSVSNLSATNGSLVDNGNGTWTFTPTANYNGTVDLSYDVTDGNGGSTPSTQQFSLAAVNDAPVGVNDTAGPINQGTTITIAVISNDTDVENDNLTVSAVNAPAAGTAAISADGKSIIYTSTGNFSGTTTFGYTLSDGNGGTATANVSVTILPVQEGGPGNDTLSGSTANDELYGNGGNDTLDGKAGADKLYGGTGDDKLIGGTGNDILEGGADNDEITGGDDVDLAYGGDGNDTFIISGTLTAAERIDGGSGTDTLKLSGNATLASAAILVPATIESLDLGGSTLTVQGTDLYDFSAMSLASGGSIAGDTAANRINGTPGNDSFTGGLGTDTLNGGAGNDFFLVGGNELSGDQLTGGAGTDTLQFTSAVTLTTGLVLTDIESLDMNGKNITVATTATVDFGSVTSVTKPGEFRGDATANSIAGTRVADIIKGDAGTDVLRGADGNDLLYGSASANKGDGVRDTFIFSSALNATSNVDTIYAFEANAIDKIALDLGFFPSLTFTGAGGSLTSGQFAKNAGGNAVDGNDFILFDTSTGNLFFDADGSGAGQKVLFAKLVGTIGGTNAVDASDFIAGP